MTYKEITGTNAADLVSKLNAATDVSRVIGITGLSAICEKKDPPPPVAVEVDVILEKEDGRRAVVSIKDGAKTENFKDKAGQDISKTDFEKENVKK